MKIDVTIILLFNPELNMAALILIFNKYISRNFYLNLNHGIVYYTHAIVIYFIHLLFLVLCLFVQYSEKKGWGGER